MENRITCVFGTDGTCTSASATNYFYDPQGQRVGKQQADTMEDYVYDPQGHIISVHDGSANLLRAELHTPEGRHVATWNPSANYGPLFWNHVDWLGTHRVRTDSTGTAREWCSDTPYGMNLACTPGDTSPMHFTGKQRDYETGLDNFGARYFGGGNSLGRFVTPDPLLNSGRPDDPQSWNRYAYVNNNPLRYNDPFGLYKWANACDEANDSACKADRDRFRAWYAGLKNAAGNLEEGSNERKQLDKEIKRIGEEDKGNVKIAFGDAGQDANGNPNAGRTFGNTITLNLNALSKLASSWGKSLGYDQSQTAALFLSLGIGLVGHEGAHLSASGFLGLSLMMHTERTALFGESATDQGLHYTDLIYKLWNESWAKVDVGTREELRNEKIQDELERQAGKEPPK